MRKTPVRTFLEGVHLHRLVIVITLYAIVRSAVFDLLRPADLHPVQTVALGATMGRIFNPWIIR